MMRRLELRGKQFGEKGVESSYYFEGIDERVLFNGNLLRGGKPVLV